VRIHHFLFLYTAWKMSFGPSHEIDPDENQLVRLARKFLPMTKQIRGDWFFTRRLKI